MKLRSLALPLVLAAPVFLAAQAAADPFTFSTGAPDGRMGLATRPSSIGLQEIEAADDFVLGVPTLITGGTFTGLLPTGVSVSDIGLVRVEIYRVFPNDSDTSRTPNVPTRANSPSDVAFDERESSLGTGDLSFSTSVLNPSFTAANSILNGINPSPGQTTGGEGSITGQEVLFNVNFTTPFTLPADHYFFVPQVQLLSGGNFFWLSAVGPAVFAGDLQAWIRNEALAPDWLRAGTDIVGGATPPRFNESFSLVGETVPEPATLTLLGTGLLLCVWRRRRHV